MTGSPLDRPAQFLKGVGPRRAEALERVGVRTARDLLYHAPRRYEDASTVSRIGTVQVGTDVTVIGEITSKGVLPTRSGLRIFQAVLRDGSGSIECSWPGQPFLDRTLRRGDLLLVTGPVRFFRRRQLQPREFVVLGRSGEVEGSGRVLPIYPTTEGLSQKVLRSVLDQNLERLLPLLVEEDALPAAVVRSVGLLSLMQAIAQLHRPTTLAEAEAGRRRVAFDELFYLQLLHARAQSRRHRERPGIAFQRHDVLVAQLYRRLPFQLTDAQTRSIAEIYGDMTSPRRMNRLLQGDVGSGKTIVALFAMLLAVDNDYQAALMAPTEILAEQHFATLSALLTGIDVRVTLLTGQLGAAERRAALAGIASGDSQIVVGTHALIQEAVAFHRLGLAVVDEQHRFGVRQRQALSAAGDRADVLVMSATPIPRSLALTLYGELDLSTLDELPPNRPRIRTVIRREDSRDQVYDFIREQVEEGRQAYIVYPLVEESEKVDLRAATDEHQRLRDQIFPELRVGLLHGQLPGDEKESIMRAFAAGELDVLVATSVIEVGIDIPNATVMVVEHADRFGLSQLHQLRGRVGRGASRSYCILIAPGAPEAVERLRVMAQTEDGFRIARADLQIRGMGDFFGARQHGIPEFRFFDPARDEDLLLAARSAARQLIGDDPELSQDAHERLRATLDTRFAERERLYQVG